MGVPAPTADRIHACGSMCRLNKLTASTPTNTQAIFARNRLVIELLCVASLCQTRPVACGIVDLALILLAKANAHLNLSLMKINRSLDPRWRQICGGCKRSTLRRELQGLAGRTWRPPFLSLAWFGQRRTQPVRRQGISQSDNIRFPENMSVHATRLALP